MIRPLDAWMLRRVLCNHEMNGELLTLPEPWKGLANYLAALPESSRLSAWEGFLCGRDDRDAIIQALANVDPEGPAPEPPGDDGGEADDWGPIRLGSLPPAEPFPLDVLPEPMARLVIEGAAAIGCPPDFLAVPALAVAAGVIGRSVSLKLKDNYFVPPTVFAACVGPPSDGKTPGFKAVTAAVKRIDEALEAAHALAVQRWEEESAGPGPEKKKPTKPPSPPKPKRIDIDDITMEALPLILADNPRGLVMVRDELTALMLGMNQFKGGKGNDRAIILKIWSGEAILKDRVNHEANIPIRCPHPCMSILGGLPPDMLGSMVDPKGRADGFLDRFLFAYPDSLPVPNWSRRGVPEETLDDWCELVGRLWARPMNHKDGRSVPHVAFFTPEAEAAWIARYDAHSAEMNAPDFPPSRRGPWGKLREYAGRLALDLACLHHASDPAKDPAAVPRVGSRVAADAWRLVAYFKTQALRVHAAIDLGPGSGGEVSRAIVEWIRKGRRRAFTEHEIKQARRWIRDADLAEALGALARRNAIREAPADRTGGRPSSPAYRVNPALLDPQNP